MSKAQIIKDAIERGAEVELCLMDPATPQGQASRITALMIPDIEAAVAVFTAAIVSWVGVRKPPGAVELRYHDLVLFDSYTSIHGPDRNLVVWDLSFGRDVTEKRVFLLNAGKPLAADLTKRYDQIFDKAAVQFEYRQGTVRTDRLKARLSA